MQSNREVSHLLDIIQSQPILRLSKQSLYTPPARIYTSLKSLYMSFKNTHEFQLLQQKIYTIPIEQNKHIERGINRITAKYILGFHLLEESDIITLINIKKYLPKDYQRQLLEEIINQINSLRDIEAVIRCYRAILREKDAIRNRATLYAYIQSKMIDKIINSFLNQDHWIKIAAFIGSLPYMSSKLLVFMADLFDKAVSLRIFKPVYKIFVNTFNFLTTGNYGDAISLQQQYEFIYVQVLMKICIKQHIVILRQRIDRYIPLLFEECKLKLDCMVEDSGGVVYQHEKIECIVQFICFGVENGCDLWAYLVSWEDKVSAKIGDIMRNMLGQCLDKMNVNGQIMFGCVKSLMELKEHSKLGAMVAKKIIMKNETLLNKLIRQFVAWKIVSPYSRRNLIHQGYHAINEGYSTIHQVHQHSLQNLFNLFMLCTKLDLSEIFVQTLRQKQAFSFYSRVIENAVAFEQLKNYLDLLLRIRPSKYGRCFAMIHQIEGGDMLSLKNFSLLAYYTKTMKITIFSNILRDISLRVPSKYIITYIFKFLDTYKYEKEYSQFRNNAIKCLNIILIRTPAQLLNNEFKKLLPFVVKILNQNENEILFKDVSEQTKEQLKRNYQQNNGHLI